MSNYLKSHFDTEGPFGLPMKDAQAKALEARLAALPDDDAFTLRRLSQARGVSELQPGGMDDSHFQMNPIVTLNHAYDQPPVGRSLWRRRARDGPKRGVKAKTHYPARPEGWTLSDWPPDLAFELVKAGLLQGKSIGFIPLKLRAPSAEEIQKNSALAQVRYIIEEWLLAEYACCYLPMQPNAVVETVSKALPSQWIELLGLPTPPSVAFASSNAIASAARRLLASHGEAELAAACERAWRKARGAID